MKPEVEIETLSMNIGKTQRELSIWVEEDDNLWIETSTYYPGCGDEMDQSHAITIKDLYEITRNLRSWSIKQADKETQKRISKLKAENEEIKKDFTELEDKYEDLRKAIKTIQYEKED